MADLGSSAFNPGQRGTIERLYSLEVRLRTLILKVEDGNLGTTDPDVPLLRTLTGTSTGADNLSAFTGNTIPDNVTIKDALQALETALETVGTTTVEDSLTSTSTTDALSANQGKILKDLLDDINTKVGGAITDMGVFTGTTIPDNVTVADALQAIETALEAITSMTFGTAISPASDDATGDAGTSTDAARADHKHPAQGVSADANNLLTVGTDGLHHLEGQDQSASNYFDIGNMRIQWGSGVVTIDGPQAFNLPAPFANTNYSIQTTRTGANVGDVLPVPGKTTTTFTIDRIDTINGNNNFDWIAIGLKP